MEGLWLSALGDLTAARGGRVLDLGGRRQRAVLALLMLAHGDVLPAEQLIHSLWGDLAPPGAPGTLQAYVSHLRGRLQPDRTARSRDQLIVSRGTGYALAIDDDAVDSRRFERLTRAAATQAGPVDAVRTLSEALALWRGPAFAEYADEPWAQPEIARLTELRGVAREQLLAARLDTEESAVLVPELEVLVAEEPLREERWRLLVLALYRTHRQGDALAALRRARQTLADELGVDPGAALRSLESEILAQSPALDAPSPPVRVTPPPRPAPAGEVLVERDRELAELRGCLVDALDGQARLVLVEGPAGIGKTRLLAEARSFGAEQGALVLTARSSQLEQQYGFGAVRQLFEALVTDPGLGAARLAGAAASASTVFDVDALSPQASPDTTLGILHGLYWLTVNLSAERPLILALDDVQWCDGGSLRFLAYLVRRLEGLPILLVATLRTGGSYIDEALLAELATDANTVQIRPSALTQDGVGELARQRLGEDADGRFIAACHRTTSGNPLLLRQLLRALQIEGVRPDAAHVDTVTAIGSRAVSSLVLRRLAGLPRATTATARAVAVLGDGATLPTVAALAGLTEPEAAGAIAALARTEVLRDEYPLGFVHPLVADAVYRDLPPGERQLQHERAARLLHDSGAPAERVAAHLLQVPRRADPWVVELLRAAAARAADRGAADAAAAYLARALDEPPDPAGRPGILLALGNAEALSNGPAAIGHLQEAYETLPDPLDRAAVARKLTSALFFSGAFGDARAVAQRADAQLPAELVDERLGLRAVEWLGGYMNGLDRGVWRRGDLALVGDGPGARMFAVVLAWDTLIAGVDRERAVELARFGATDRLLLELDPGWMWVVLGVVLTIAEEDVDAFWYDSLAHTHRAGSMFGTLGIHLWRGYSQWRKGELREAYQSLLTSREQSVAWGLGILGYVEGFLIGVLLDLGDPVAARAHLDRVEIGETPGDSSRFAHEARGKVLLAEGKYAAALASFEHARQLQEQGANPQFWEHRSLRARALAGLGRGAEAVALAEDELASARRWGTPGLVGRVLILLGELRGGPHGLPELREAVALLEKSRAPLEYARALRALATQGPPEDAVPLLNRAYEIAQRCGAAGLCRTVAEDLDRAGAPAPAGLDRAGALTTTERRIAVMTAAGADDREIAQALFLTPRTVETILRSVLDRLGLDSVTGLGAALTS